MLLILIRDRIDAWNDDNLDNLPVYEPGLADVVKEARGQKSVFLYGY